MHQHKHLSIISIIITSPKRNSGKKRNFLHLEQRKVESRDSKYQEDLDSLRPPDRPPSLMNGDWAGARRLSHVMSHDVVRASQVPAQSLKCAKMAASGSVSPRVLTYSIHKCSSHSSNYLPT